MQMLYGSLDGGPLAAVLIGILLLVAGVVPMVRRHLRGRRTARPRATVTVTRPDHPHRASWARRDA